MDQEAAAGAHPLVEQLRAENAALRREVERLLAFQTLAHYDEVTGLCNRRRFEECLALEWKRAFRYRDNLALILIDLDDFKLINDTAGHAAGDAVLALVGRVMMERCRDCDLSFRVGGDEFAYLLPSTDRPGAAVLMRRFRSRLAELEGGLGLPAGLRVGLSCGVATNDVADSPATLVASADREMYANKRAGKASSISQIRLAYADAPRY
jgi:diguanylate cyclase (GGDEF)-like protein